MRLRLLAVVPVAMASVALAAPAGAAPDPYSTIFLTGPLNGAVVTTTSVTTIEDGSTRTSVDTDHYDTRGRETLQTGVSTDDSDVVVSRTERSWEYDGKGRLYREIDLSDGDGDGSTPAQTIVITTTYDKSNYVIGKVLTYDETSDGVIDRTETTAFSNDHRGRVLSSAFTDSSGYTTTIRTTYDGHGRITAVTIESRTPEGILQGSALTTNTYDAQGHLVAKVQSQYDATGALDNRQVSSATYDSRGNVLTLNVSADVDGDGVINSHQLDVLAYDSGGRPLTQTHSDFVGTTSTVASSEVFRWSYDSKGRQVTFDDAADHDANGTVDATEHEATSYDGLGRLLRDVLQSDGDADGTAEATTTTDYTYDSKGRLASVSIVSTDLGGPGSTTLDAYRYPSRTMFVETVTVDVGSDGTVEQTLVLTRTVA